jgi:hypothetical protein
MASCPYLPIKVRNRRKIQMKSVSTRVLLCVCLVLLTAVGFTQVIKQQQSYLDQVKFKDSALGVKTQPIHITQALPQLH